MITSILKRSFLFCSFITIGFIAEAQFTFSPEISGGITSAIQTTPPNVVNNTSTKTRSNANLNGTIGVLAAYQFDDLWAVNSGIFYQYIQPTFNQNTSPNTIVTDKLNYINIPLEITHINDQLKKGWYYGVGINLGLGISGQEDLATTGLPSISKGVKFDGEVYPQDPNYAHFNFFNIGAIGKVGYFFGKMYIGGEANLGLSNLSPHSADYNYKYKINTYNLHIGYTFNRKVVKPATPPADTDTTP